MRIEAPPGFSLPRFLRQELALRPGRVASIARIAICCTLVVIVWMVFQIPEPAYAVYLVFLVSGSDAAVSLITAVGGTVAATLAILLSILLYTLDAADPSLRLPLMALSMYLGMFLSRTIAIGPIAFLLGFLLVITQTIVDVMPSTEALTRFLLWLWLVAAGPAIFTALVNLWTGPNPVRLLRSSAVLLLETVAKSLHEQNSSLLLAHSVRPVTLADLRSRAAILDKRLKATTQVDTDLIETLDAIVKVASMLPPVPAAVRDPLVAACIACRNAVQMEAAPVPNSPWPALDSLQQLDSDSRPVVMALATLLERLGAGLTNRVDAKALPHANATERKSLFIPDAFSNREHARFAFKATLAAMTTYIIYSGLDWPGIRTAMITCFFVALGSTGETVHKLSLRVSGALIGGLLGGLCIVYLLPHMTDIGELSLLVLAAAGLCAWVSTSSELLAYAGMQMALAFFLGVLQGYGPTTELTVLRDRLIGIVLGNVVMSIVFSVLWPTSARVHGRQALANAMRSLSRLLLEHQPRPSVGIQLGVTRAIDQARRIVALGTFEAPLLPIRSAPKTLEQRSIDTFEEVARAVFVVVNQPPSGPRTLPFPNSEDIATWLADRASHWDMIEGAGSSLAAPVTEETLFELPGSLPVRERSAFEARALLRKRIMDFAAHVT